MTPADRAPAIPEVPPFHGEWSGSNSPLACSSPVEAGVHWTSAGRRIALTGSAAAGLESVAAGQVRLVAGALGFPGAALEPITLVATPSEAHRVFRGGGDGSVERWFTALDHPVAFRELDVPDSVAVEQTWYIRAPGWALVTAIASDRQVAMVAADAGGPTIVLAVDGGRLDAAEAEPGAAALHLTGTGRVRFMCIIGADGVELERALQAVARRGFTGLRSQRIQHARLLREYASGLATPSERLDAAFEWAKVRADEMVRASGSPAAAEALLAVGWRDGSRELLKAAHGAAMQASPLADLRSVSAEQAADLPADQLLRWTIMVLWGVEPDAPRRAVSLAPRLPSGWTRMALSRLRVGPSAIDCELRTRGGRLTARVRRAGGPPLTVTLAPAGVSGRSVSVDGIELAGGRARFEAIGEHEVVFEATA